MQCLRCYTITHLEGDPCIKKNGTLELGNFKCMKKMRPYTNKDDWIVAKLGKTYHDDSHIFLKTSHDLDNKKYLFYAMRVTSIKFQKSNRIICSKKGNYYWFCGNFLEIPKRFYGFFSKGQAYKKTILEEANKFIEWIKSQKPKTTTNFGYTCEQYLSKANPNKCDCSVV